jgi:uncharacterized Zn-binding protein involved in type VI secretion
MGSPAARSGDQVNGVDLHLVAVPPPSPPALLPHPFSGAIDGQMIASVTIEGRPAAVVGSTATNAPPHLPTTPGLSFVSPPANRGVVFLGSDTVAIGGRPAARLGDRVRTCNDPIDVTMGSVTSGASTVFVG